MPINAPPEYMNAEKRYWEASTDEQRLEALEEMIKHLPTHKGAEALRKNIRTRYKKLKEKLERRQKEKRKGKKEGIKKEGIQIVLVGLTNSGKSCLISKLTNAKPKIADYEFTTKQPIIGTLTYQNIKFQMIDMPAVNYETFDQGLANTADILLIVVTETRELNEIIPFIKKSTGKKIVVLNKIDLLSEAEKRKLSERLKSKRHDFVLVSCKTKQGFEELKDNLFANSGVIRIYTKEPRKPKSPLPVVMPSETSVGEISKKIFHSKVKVKEARVTGPSSKFPNQKVSLSHKLKDKDVVEFYVE